MSPWDYIFVFICLCVLFMILWMVVFVIYDMYCYRKDKKSGPRNHVHNRLRPGRYRRNGRRRS